jgi:hypothetical protein
MKKKRKFYIKLGAIAFILGIYPLCILIYTWTCVFQSDLEGGKNGPLDAYRHTLASAIVSHTLGEWAVKATTFIMESKTSASGAMDRHNNRIGMKIGSHATSFKDLEPMVRARVMKGKCSSTKTDQITWLPKTKWRNSNLW